MVRFTAMGEVETNLRQDTEALALPQGRRVGQPGHEVARDYLLQRMQELALRPFATPGFELPFEREGQVFSNLIARIPGQNPELPPILIGAHYDSVIDAPCADDNATAVAVTLSMAEQIPPQTLNHDLVIALFDSEEPPYFHTSSMGSTRFYEDHCQDLSFTCVIVMDLIGHDVELHHPAAVLLPGLKHLLFVLGAESSPSLPSVVEAAASPCSDLRILATLNRYIGDLSDHHAFRLGGEPFLFLSCGQGKHYHQPSDDLSWINFSKLAQIDQFVRVLIRELDELEAVSSQMHDPVDFEIRTIQKSFGIALPLLLKSVGLPPLRTRRDLDAFVTAFAAGLG